MARHRTYPNRDYVVVDGSLYETREVTAQVVKKRLMLDLVARMRTLTLPIVLSDLSKIMGLHPNTVSDVVWGYPRTFHTRRVTMNRTTRPDSTKSGSYLLTLVDLHPHLKDPAHGPAPSPCAQAAPGPTQGCSAHGLPG